MKNLPRLRFAHLPTPIEPLPRLSVALGGPTLMIKRDDQTGLAFGGNKTRKLEFLLAEAQAQGARTLVTTGAVQSNHCRQTAAAAARFGLDCILVLTLPENPSARERALSGNLLLDHLFRAEIIWAERHKRDEALREVFETAWKAGRRPYLVPYGGSSPVGAAAYAYAVRELMDQEAHPQWIVFASSSGGTQAGLIVGSQLFGFQGKVFGISVDETAEILQTRVAGLATEVASLLDEPLKFEPQDVMVNADYLGEGYGVMGEVEREAIRLFARYEGILLDPVYTGRAAAGLIDLIRKGFFHKADTVLFWHTGGTPALFAARYADLY